MYIQITKTRVVTLRGEIIRESKTEDWAAFVAWARDNRPRKKYSKTEWEALPEISKARLQNVAPQINTQAK